MASNYATLEDVRALVPQDVLTELTDDEGLSEVNEARVAEALTRAASEVDAYAGGRYAVPLNPVPEMVRTLTVDMALYHLYARRVSAMPEVRAERYRTALRQLEGVARGSISLGVAEAPEAADMGDGAETNRAVSANVFDRETLGGF